MKENTIKGTLTELQCQKDFIIRGFLVSQPIVADSKYDYIVDINGQLYRIQCKSATLSEDKTFINLKTKTTNVRTMKDTFYSSEDIDYFYTTYNNIAYLIPVNDAGHGDTRLRFTSLNKNNPNIRWAKNYELDKILQKMEEVDN